MEKNNIDLSELTQEQRDELYAQLEAQRKEKDVQKREAYESLRDEFAKSVEQHLNEVVDVTLGFKTWLREETDSFVKILREYGKLHNDDQKNFTIVSNDFKIIVKFNKVKGFDERADVAADRLIDYLRRYMEASEKGANDPMYQLAMTLLERNKMGDLDYKSISKLYELEDKFDAEYSEIMALFRESNVVYKNSVNYYFEKRDEETGVWKRVEPSFCRM